MSSLERLSQDDRDALLSGINYLNMEEIKEFCESHRISYSIHFQKADGSIVKTRDLDRKAIVLGRILHYLMTGTLKGKTIFPASVVNLQPRPSRVRTTARIFYGQYRNGDREILKVMKELTGGEFKFGAIAQEVIRDCWTRGQTPTYQKFALLWRKASDAHIKPNREYAFLTDLSEGTVSSDWKVLRAKKARRVLQLLRRITSKV